MHWENRRGYRFELEERRQVEVNQGRLGTCYYKRGFFVVVRNYLLSFYCLIFEIRITSFLVLHQSSQVTRGARHDSRSGTLRSVPEIESETCSDSGSLHELKVEKGKRCTDHRSGPSQASAPSSFPLLRPSLP